MREFAPVELTLHIETGGCELADAERGEMEGNLASMHKVVATFPQKDLRVLVHRHPRTHDFHVKATLSIGTTRLFTGDRAQDLHPAWERCVRTLVHKLKALKERMDGKPAREKATKGTRHEVRPAEPPHTDVLDAAVGGGDFAAFREGLAAYEAPLEQRISQRIALHPEAQARLGRDLSIHDVVDEVFLTAFEGWRARPHDRLGNWLESLIDPSIVLFVGRGRTGPRDDLGFVRGMSPES